jgi:hypothetical protein
LLYSLSPILEKEALSLSYLIRHASLPCYASFNSSIFFTGPALSNRCSVLRPYSCPSKYFSKVCRIQLCISLHYPYSWLIPPFQSTFLNLSSCTSYVFSYRPCLSQLSFRDSFPNSHCIYPAPAHISLLLFSHMFLDSCLHLQLLPYLYVAMVCCVVVSKRASADNSSARRLLKTIFLSSTSTLSFYLPLLHLSAPYTLLCLLLLRLVLC